MKNKTLLLIAAFLMLWALWQRAFGQTVLDRYIKTALDSNQALKQSTFDLEKAKIDLERARSLFYPQVEFNSQYTLASGADGRGGVRAGAAGGSGQDSALG